MDDELDRQIEEHLRAAPTYEAPESLRLALGKERPGSPLALAQRRAAPKKAGTLVGLAASVLLAASLLAIAVSRSVSGPVGGPKDLRLGWQAAARSPDSLVLARPVAMGSSLVALTSDGSDGIIDLVSASTWSSPDGSSWSRLSQVGAISEPGRSIGIVAACPDGHGGLVAAGQSAVASDPTLALNAAIWHSSDGRTWDRSAVDGAVGATVQDMAVGSGTVVAVGLAQPGKDGRLVAFGYSAIGVVPEATNVPPAQALVWVSNDGSSWRLLPPDATLAGSISGVSVLGSHIIVTTSTRAGSSIYVGSPAG